MINQSAAADFSFIKKLVPGPTFILPNTTLMKYNLSMNNDYKRWFQTGDYQAVLNMTENRRELEALVARFQALVITGADQEALNLIQTHFEVMKLRVGDIFLDHRNLLMKSSDRILGYQWLARYQELPYTSIIIEEAMKEFKAWLDEPVITKNFDLQAWRHQIEEKDLNLVEAALERLPLSKVRGEWKRLTKFMLAKYPMRLRYQTLSKLIMAKVEVPCFYAIDGIECEVTPTLLTLPEDNLDLQAFTKQFPTYGFNPSERELAHELLLQYATAIFPMEPPYEDEEHLAAALRYLVGQYLHRPAIAIDEVSRAISLEIEAALVRFDAI